MDWARVSADSLAIDPTSENIVYAGSSGHRVLKTINGGTNWVELPSLGLSTRKAIVIDPSDTKTLYAGVTDGWGIYKTINGGAQWSRVLEDVNVSSLAIDPVDTRVIFAGSSSYDRFDNYYDKSGGVYKSTNGGETWTEVLTDTSINAIAIDPTSTSIVYVATQGQGVLKSIDGGTSWIPVNSGLTYLIVRSVAVDPGNTNVIYAGTWEGGVFKSTDGGENWTPMNEGLANTYILSLVIDPNNPKTLYVGTQGGGVFKWVQP